MSEHEQRMARGQYPWTPDALLKAVEMVVRKDPGSLIRSLKKQYGPELGEAHMLRVMAAMDFVRLHMEALQTTGLAIVGEQGTQLGYGVVKALATAAFSRNVGKDPLDPRWDFEPSEIFRLARECEDDDDGTSGET